MKSWETVAAGVGVLAVIAVLVYVSYQWGASAERERLAAAPLDTIITSHPVLVPLPIPVVSPNPVHAIPDTVQDTKAIDSLVQVVKQRDTDIRALLFTRSAVQRWESHTDTTQIVGSLSVVYNPRGFTFNTHVTIDSLVVPERVREILRTITVYKTPIEPWVVSAVCVVLLILNLIAK